LDRKVVIAPAMNSAGTTHANVWLRAYHCSSTNASMIARVVVCVGRWRALGELGRRQGQEIRDQEDRQERGKDLEFLSSSVITPQWKNVSIWLSTQI
jgi:hypothetical protein